MKIKNIKLLFLTILLSQMAGVVGSVATVSAIPTWYADLVKPSFSPPNYLFGPVWITLYTLMGIAWYLVWIKGTKNKENKFAVKLFGAHLVINALWSLIFFGLKDLGLAFIVIVVLWIMIGYLIKIFYRIDKRAGQLLLPYWAWVSFASLLNFSIFWLN